MALQNTSAALLTTTLTSTFTGTATQWVTRWAFPQVTISCPLPDLASASYPYAWMTATGEALTSDLSSYSASARLTTTSSTDFTGCPATTTDIMATSSATDMAYYNTSSAPSTTASPLISSLMPESSIYTTNMTLITSTTDGAEAQTVTPPLTTAPTTANTATSSADNYITETESVYVFVSDGYIVSTGTSDLADLTATATTGLTTGTLLATGMISSSPSPLASIDHRRHLLRSNQPESQSWTTRRRLRQ